jgi:hypothetical protein
MPTRNKYIAIPRGSATRICKRLGIGRTTLYDALNYRSYSESAKRTRDIVLKEYGGFEDRKVRL